MATSNSAVATGDLVIRRIYQAPRQLVYDAWTRPEHLQHWQGAPEGMTVTVVTSEVRAGGRFKICMHGPDGADHWLEGQYREVTPPERLVFTHSWLDADGRAGPETVVTISFEARGDQTLLTLQQTGFAAEGSRQGHQGGWTSTFDRLEKYLAGPAGSR